MRTLGYSRYKGVRTRGFDFSLILLYVWGFDIEFLLPLDPANEWRGSLHIEMRKSNHNGSTSTSTSYPIGPLHNRVQYAYPILV